MANLTKSEIFSQLPPRQRILVIDDYKDTLEAMSMILAALHQDYIVTDNGINGLSLLRNWQPDLAFIDVGLPDMSGIEVVKALHMFSPEVKVYTIAFSGWGQREDIARNMEAGFMSHTTKPLGIEGIRDSLIRSYRWHHPDDKLPRYSELVRQ